jgi:hypothetical protein
MLLALSTNIRLGWKSQPVTNSLAYYEHSKISTVKDFIITDPGVDVTKPFLFLIIVAAK